MLQRLDAKDMSLTLSSPITETPAALKAYDPVLDNPTRLTLSFKPSTTPARKVLADVENAGLEVRDFSTKDADLEDIFIRLTHGDDDARI